MREKKGKRKEKLIDKQGLINEHDRPMQNFETSTSTSNTWMAREYLGLSSAAPLSVKNVHVRNGVGQMVDSLWLRTLHILYRISQAGVN